MIVGWPVRGERCTSMAARALLVVPRSMPMMNWLMVSGEAATRGGGVVSPRRRLFIVSKRPPALTPGDVYTIIHWCRFISCNCRAQRIPDVLARTRPSLAHNVSKLKDKHLPGPQPDWSCPDGATRYSPPPWKPVRTAGRGEGGAGCLDCTGQVGSGRSDWSSPAWHC